MIEGKLPPRAEPNLVGSAFAALAYGVQLRNYLKNQTPNNSYKFTEETNIRSPRLRRLLRKRAEKKAILAITSPDNPSTSITLSAFGREISR